MSLDIKKKPCKVKRLFHISTHFNRLKLGAQNLKDDINIVNKKLDDSTNMESAAIKFLYRNSGIIAFKNNCITYSETLQDYKKIH
jgi:hypothetical protein